MKKYLRKLAATFKYVFESNWDFVVVYVTEGDHITRDGHWHEDPRYVDNETVTDAIAAFNEEWAEDKEMIEQFMFNELGIPTEIGIKIDGPKVVTTVTTKQELNKEQLDQIQDYISGQFSDGFGESFEQHEISSEKRDGDKDEEYPAIQDLMSFEEWLEYEGKELPDEDDENYDDEYNELSDEYSDAVDTSVSTTFSYYMSLWPENFKMTLK